MGDLCCVSNLLDGQRVGSGNYPISVGAVRHHVYRDLTSAAHAVAAGSSGRLWAPKRHRVRQTSHSNLGALIEVTRPPKPGPVREAIANSVAANLKSYDVAAFCERIGLAPQGPGEEPFRSKRLYVNTRLQALDLAGLVPIARAVLTEWDDEDLHELVDRAGATGVAGELKNLIFASDGPKPEIVLRDALNNTIEITKGANTCLVYNRPLPDDGLSWAALVDWWATETLHETNQDVAARHLYRRLVRSLASPPEHLLFRTYAHRYANTEHASTPALIPQVYLHYDPYMRRDPAQRPGAVIHQRMDFLVLLPGRRRVVLEVDGQQHYTTDDGRASPSRYATTVSEDRRLRLAGYEVYRFGGAELMNNEEDGRALLEQFFTRLLDDPPPGL
jgi:very-short-patch-repair endonuclease